MCERTYKSRGFRSEITVRRLLNRIQIEIKFHGAPFPEILDPGRPRSRTAFGCGSLSCASLQVYSGSYYQNKGFLG